MSSAFTIVAKAGGSGEAAENTESALRALASVTPPGWARLAIEVDVRLSADGVLLALHDATLERTTNGSGLVRALPGERLRELRTRSGERIPRLEEVCELSGDRELVVEAHDADAGAAQALLRTLQRLPVAVRERVIVASEHQQVIAVIRERAPGQRTSATAREAWRKLLLERLRLERWAPSGCTWMVPAVHRGLTVVTRRFAESARRAGDEVWVYVVDAPEQLRALRGLGVSGCFTTRPAALCAQLGLAAAS
jgi:glycerophosphoryl diester phosphodiesterase